MQQWHLDRIPKIAYFYWGTEIFPWVRYLTLETFKKHHPDWDMRLYVKPVLDVYPGTDPEPTKKQWQKVKDLGIPIIEFDLEKELGVDFPLKYITIYADIFRYVLLKATGGFYVDMDNLFFRALGDAPFNNPNNFYNDVMMLPPPYHHFVMGVQGASFFQKILDLQLSNLPKTGDQILYTTACTAHVQPNTNDRVLFLPMGVTEENFTAGGPQGPDAVALNWHGSGTYGKYQAVTEENYMESDHPLAACIRYCLHGNMGKSNGIGTFQWIARGE